MCVGVGVSVSLQRFVCRTGCGESCLHVLQGTLAKPAVASCQCVALVLKFVYECCALLMGATVVCVVTIGPWRMLLFFSVWSEACSACHCSTVT